MPFGGIDRKVIRVIELKKPLACRRSPWPRRPPKGDMYIWLTVAVQISKFSIEESPPRGEVKSVHNGSEIY